MEELMLKIDNVSKQYKLGQIGGTTLYHELKRLRARRKGLADPTKQIGAKDYNKGELFMALDGVSFEVKKGERVGIIGHNGAGKSTLLKLISRITAPTSGTIGMNGRIASMLEVGTGFHPELTGRENVYMNGAILGMTKKEIDAKIEDIIEFSECREFIDTPVRRYSSGMYVKLAFSVAAHLDSEILIMDEVLAVGDMAFQKKCLDKMNDVSRQEGRTILYVSHNMNTIRQLCDRVIVLDHGKVVFDGGVEEGIGVYMDVSKDVRVHFDYTDYPKSYDEKRSLEMISLDVLDRESNQVEQGDIIHFILHAHANETVSDVHYRIEFFYADGSVVGTAFSDKTISAQEGENVDIKMSIGTKNFSPGAYSSAALFFDTDHSGDQAVLHRVQPAIAFEIIDDEGEAIIWLHQWWGHTKYDDICVHAINRFV